MRSSKKEKKFDSVKMMRKTRDKLSKKYSQAPNKEMNDLKIIRTKYRIKSKVKAV